MQATPVTVFRSQFVVKTLLKERNPVKFAVKSRLSTEVEREEMLGPSWYKHSWVSRRRQVRSSPGGSHFLPTILISILLRSLGGSLKEHLAAPQINRPEKKW
ncbi:hypothetical protein TNCV_542411 [Trichonephila clavipes]|nr:hypothetical protein TNCV_542411 [Trichonephila clavipes]